MMYKSLLTHELAVNEINNVVPNILVQKKKNERKSLSITGSVKLSCPSVNT